MSIAPYMAELADPAKDITATGLAQLSGLLDEEAEELRAGWPAIPVRRRQEVIARLLDLAEENVEMDFIAVFRHAMTDEDAGVRERAVAGLWETDDRHMIAPLIDRLLHDDAPSVRAASATVLGHFAQLAEDRKLIQRDRDRVFDALMTTLRNENEPLDVRRRALEAVAVFRTQEVAAWVRWGYDSGDARLRQSAIYAMGRSCDETWEYLVQRELSSDDPAMRYEAANAARELASENAVPRLAEMVADSDRQVAMAALHALGGIGGTKAKRFLRGLAAMSQDDAVREAAEESLRVLQSDEADLSLIEIDRLDGDS